MTLKVKAVRQTKKEGEKVYEYEYNNNYDFKQYYVNYKEKKGRSTCQYCGSDVNNIYLEKHQKNSAKCQKAQEAKQKEDHLNQLLEQLETARLKFLNKN